MPRWYWLDTDGCWFCKNKKNCNNCSIVKRYRKKYFTKKEEGKH
nr:MAG TPA: antistasin family protein [Caudoviricetes sp.]